MSFRTKFALVVLSATLSLYTVVGGLFSTRAQQPKNDPSAQLRIFENVLQHIQNDYVDEPNLDKVRAGALRGLAYGLDPYSTYLTPDQVRDYNDKVDNNKSGIGAELSQVASYLYVIAPVKGSPAEQAGVRAGDIIEYIDGKATRDISLYDARELLNGAPGTEVKLRILRANARPQTISVSRGNFKLPAAEARMEAGKVGILRINSLSEGEGADVRARLQDLVKQGAQKIVLDLRSVAGGSLNEGVTVANLFIKEGTLAQTIGRENKTLKTFTADSKTTLFNGPLVTIIDGGTAGAAEIIASAILERKRGDVVGEKSFGAGAEQQLFTLRDGDGLLLTTIKWANASGKPFLGADRASSGVVPSVEVKKAELAETIDPEDLTGNDDDAVAKPAQPNDKRDVAPEAGAPKAQPQEDLQMKKALELLRDKPAAQAQRAA
ncbi:MAG: carboxyl-terminal processing protease [Blastocatellia bacterium]|jgi:carboxyl-terminal processing protease|nr:carboxyl-terminal processing protease [Blastocatellia bacterium]